MKQALYEHPITHEFTGQQPRIAALTELFNEDDDCAVVTNRMRKRARCAIVHTARSTRGVYFVAEFSRTEPPATLGSPS